METLKLHIDKYGYSKKPKGQADRIRKSTQFYNEAKNYSLSEIKFNVENGHTISPGVMKKGCCANNWVQQQLFLVDIDNKNDDIPFLTVEEVIKICELAKIELNFYYYTFSHTEERPKFRLGFIMNEIIVEEQKRKVIAETLTGMFNQSDKSVIPANSIFFGTDKQFTILDEESRITFDNIIYNFTPITNSQTSSNQNNNNLKKYIDNYDFLSYLKERNGKIIQENDTYIKFHNCEICGHYDDLVYYHKNKNFYCFGGNGRIGGTIIDYIIITENLSLKESIDKFLYDLCKLEKNKSEVKPKELEYIVASDLQKMKLPKITFFVEKILPQGLTVMCSAPKTGKSWLALDLCLSISKGEDFLNFKTTKVSCLYLALEDSYNRLKERMNKLLKDKIAPSNFYYVIRSDMVNNGLIEQLENFLLKFPDTKVIVIDTLQKIRNTTKNNAYAEDYKDLGAIKQFADGKGLSIIVIHHTRKGGNNGDSFEKISGTNAIMGSADTTWLLEKNDRNNENTHLSITGRDVDYNGYIINFNKETCKWLYVSNIDKYFESIERKKYNENTLVDTIKTLVEDNEGCYAGTIKSIILKHKELFDFDYATNAQKLRNEIIKLAPMLLEYDGIKYIPASKNPTANGRIQNFKKVVNLVVNV